MYILYILSFQLCIGNLYFLRMRTIYYALDIILMISKAYSDSVLENMELCYTCVDIGAQKIELHETCIILNFTVIIA